MMDHSQRLKAFRRSERKKSSGSETTPRNETKRGLLTVALAALVVEGGVADEGLNVDVAHLRRNGNSESTGLFNKSGLRDLPR
jgi:hypothetical protein